MITAIECLAKPKPGALEADDAPQSCVSPELQADVKGYSEETWHGSAHVERWLRVLQTFSGTANDSTVMTPAEAQEMADRWSNGRWDPVVDALQCLEVEALNDQTEVQAEEPEDTPLPLQAEETPMPAQSDPVRFTTFRVYFHDATPNPGSGEYRINEDDYWEAELIIHLETNRATSLSGELCINHDLWSGNEHWNNGPITLRGFDNYKDLAFPDLKGVSVQYGHWQCTDPINTDPTPPNVTILYPDDNSKIGFVYRTTVRIRDNNVVEDDFSIADDLEFRYVDILSGTTKWRTELCDLDLGCDNGVTEGDPRIPPTPPNTQPTTFDNTSLPIIEEDDVSWIKLHKPRGGEWTLSVYKPLMVTDGKDCSADEARQQAELDQLVADEPDGRLHSGIRANFAWSFDSDCDIWWKTVEGLVLRIGTEAVAGSNTVTGNVDVLIPATNGIVRDVDYLLHDLARVRSTESGGPKRNNPSATIDKYGLFPDICGGSFAGIPQRYTGASAQASGLPNSNLSGSKFPIDEPPVGSDLCR